ncbi:hypothetical protein [Ruminococcus albus]|uniref:Uncharacterized protein n=1 Tax=Ruminococcus albus TaxID=1264 RepID=A0A1I1NUP3_RUMAL|nr:hypothetical protein [Ruminococcus albus]SFD01126.1 hypothetical protein SAMN02910406_02866 [Ruminococcus albus]
MTDEKKRKLKKLLTGKGSHGIIIGKIMHCDGDDKTVIGHTAINHIIFRALSWLIFDISLLRMLFVYHKFPSETGVHFKSVHEMTAGMSVAERLHEIFHAYQPYDVTGKKILVFYPFFVSAAALLLGGWTIILLRRIVTRRGSERSAETLRIISGLQIAFDISAFIVTLYFCGIWADRVIKLLPMKMMFTQLYAWGILLVFFDLIIFAIDMKMTYRKKEEEK